MVSIVLVRAILKDGKYRPLFPGQLNEERGMFPLNANMVAFLDPADFRLPLILFILKRAGELICGMLSPENFNARRCGRGYT